MYHTTELPAEHIEQLMISFIEVYGFSDGLVCDPLVGGLVGENHHHHQENNISAPAEHKMVLMWLMYSLMPHTVR
jgi:hypothetical protein